MAATVTDENDDVDIEYVYEAPPQDELFQNFAHIFDKFAQFHKPEGETNSSAKFSRQQDDGDENNLALVSIKQQQQPGGKEVQESGEDKQENEAENKVSKRKQKQLTRLSVADLKQKVARPELVELHDITAKDPIFLLQLKSVKNSVPVPRHWSSKRRYLQGKRGYEKQPFQLPDFIRQTGIMEMRETIQDKDSGKSLKAKTRERVQPKMGKIQMDYQQLHDAFFKWQTKPNLTIHGDLYYEGKEFEQKFKKKPGELSNELRRALGMPTGPDANKYPPPWLTAMRQHGPPPSYPYLRIPGLNCPFPEEYENDMQSNDVQEDNEHD